MGTQKNMLEIQKRIKKLNKEIENLKLQIPKIHLTKSEENDYDIKSQIITKQTQLLELMKKQLEGEV